jgi:D-alanyl-D-alanine dipeptidase
VLPVFVLAVSLLAGGFVPAAAQNLRDAQQFHINPLHPVQELRREALQATPPRQPQGLQTPDLVEVAPLDPTLRLDIRYATSDNFMGAPFYTQARAFLQRPAAEALVRVQQSLASRGYGLMIYDAYRPWYVTKMFWEGTPPKLRRFVANPANGSRHNRGCAVDLTLYRLGSGQPVEMPSDYDEMSPRAYADYSGGTAGQRSMRELLRASMEAEGFKQLPVEWWHFDYFPCHYPVMNVPFENLARTAP